MTDISIVIPAKNEAENIEALLDGIDAALAGRTYEVIVVDDASDDGMEAILKARMARAPQLRVLRHDRSGGQSAAVNSGVKAARGAICATLDGDGQNPPEELPGLIAPLEVPGAERIGLVAGQRVGRQDTLSKKLASRFANKLRGWVLNDGTRDTGCGLKAFRREPYLNLPYFDHMHRYLPALMQRAGWQVQSVPVNHRPRSAGVSKYNNLGRALVGIADLRGVAWLIRRSRRCDVQEL